MKYLYKYPQAAYPYDDLVRTSMHRTQNDLEYELIDTGVFDQDRYFDVFVEYAKESPEDILIAISVCNRGPEAASLHVLATLWYRNTWWASGDAAKPSLKQVEGRKGVSTIAASHPTLGERYLSCEGGVSLLFTENETNTERLFGTPNAGRHVKDGINNHIVHGQYDGVNPARTGTKASAHYQLSVSPGETALIRLRLSDAAPSSLPRTSAKAGSRPFGAQYDRMFQLRRREADEFYDAITPPSVAEDARNVIHQALAGMLWTKQCYIYDLDR
jgi:hypothetical protein